MGRTKKVLFVCRGNAFRSIIAEAYLKSKQLPDVEVRSAGTVANDHYAQNVTSFSDIPDMLTRHGIEAYRKHNWGEQLEQSMLDKADVVILLNDIVRKEAETAGFTLPTHTRVWNVIDMGEAERTPKDPGQELQFKEDAYQEICALIDNFVSSGL